MVALTEKIQEQNSGQNERCYEKGRDLEDNVVDAEK